MVVVSASEGSLGRAGNALGMLSWGVQRGQRGNWG